MAIQILENWFTKVTEQTATTTVISTKSGEKGKSVFQSYYIIIFTSLVFNKHYEAYKQTRKHDPHTGKKS